MNWIITFLRLPLTALSCISLMLALSSTAAAGCDTRYPVVFVAGNAFTPSAGTPHQWGRIPARLDACGAQVFHVNWDNPLATIEDKGIQLADKISTIMAQSGAYKVNLIAHSQGGLVARYYISSMGHDAYVASLTTVGTPHRGMAIAGFVENSLLVPLGLADMMCGLEGRVGVNGLDGYTQMTPDNMIDHFNPANPDSPNVYYQSFSGAMNPNPLFALSAINALVKGFNDWSDSTRITLALFEGILHDVNGFIQFFLGAGLNDGTTEVSSAKWGHYLGTQRGPRHWLFGYYTHGITHLDEVDMSMDSKWDAPAYYEELVEYLKSQGF